MPLPPEAAAALDRLELFGIHLGLDRPRRLLAELGSPQLAIPVVLVAGTNGKGSVAVTLSSILQAAGYRTGLYTSPHLERVEERLRIDGVEISGERLGARILETLAAAERVLDSPPTYFEALTAAAFREMADAGDESEPVDIAVVEVGLGGRLDATNTAEPVLSLITPISLEHRDWLGETTAAIAREKAGILRRGRPAIAWGSDPEARAALRQTAREAGAELTFGDEVVIVGDSEPLGWEGQSFDLTTPRASYRLTTPLLGEHQLGNTALAVLAAEALAAAGWGRIDEVAIESGVREVSWPGRLEVVDLPPGAGPVSGPGRVLLDAGHNPDAALHIAAFVRGMTERGAGPVDLLVGLLGDKEAAAILPPLAAVARHVVLTRPPHARGRDPRELARLLAGGGRPEAQVEPDLGPALDRALGLGGETLLVCGSFYLVGGVRRLLRARLLIPEAREEPG